MIRLPKIYRLGTSYTSHVLNSKVEITGKLDGSQFRIYKPSEGVLLYGSRNARWDVRKDYNKQFKPVVDLCLEYEDDILQAVPVGCTIFGEYIGKRNKHRIHYLTDEDLFIFNFFYDGIWYPADWISLPFPKVKQIVKDKVMSISDCLDLLKEISPDMYTHNNLVIPDEERMEGIVIKNYDPDFPSYSERFAKLVHPRFKEITSKMFPLDKEETKKESAFLKYALTRQRVEKCVWYLRENDDEFALHMNLMPKLMPLVLEDILREEIADWLLAKKPDVFHFKAFKKAIGSKVAHYLGLIIHDWLREENV